MSFAGLRVLSLESRRSVEMAELIRKQGGEPVMAPSMREVPVEDSSVTDFARWLFAGEFDMMVLLTGVGTRQLSRVIADRFPGQDFVSALSRLAIAARGPKPVAALREMGLVPAVVAPEPNTWRELLAALDGRPERRIAVQEYGRANPELLDGLRARGAEVTAVRVYQYGLPNDSDPLRRAARQLVSGEIPVALFTTAVQIMNLAAVAKDEGIEMEMLDALRKCRVMSIGPTTSEALEEFGIRPEFEPSHPKMGLLVREAAERIEAS
jgi:uroporphyrinogen-III synthase